MHVLIGGLVVGALKLIGGRTGMHRLMVAIVVIAVGAALVALTQRLDLLGMLRAMHGG